MPAPDVADDRRAISDRTLAWLLVVCAVVGLVAAFVLTLEKLELIEDADYTPSCSINPVLNCGSIMKTDQAELLGFPNPLIGIAAFPMVLTTGVALLAGGTLRRWFWLGLQAGVTAGLGLVGWLVFQSLYEIGALCPYCMVVWVVVLPLFWYVTLRNVGAGVFGDGVARSRPGRLAMDWHALGLVVLYAVVLVLVAEQFWYYWRTLL